MGIFGFKELLTSCRFTIATMLLLVAMTTGLQAQFSYTSTNGAITITRYKGIGGAVVIPSKIMGLPVTGIGGSAFKNCITVTNVTIPDSVVRIEKYAFFHCPRIKSVQFRGNAPSISSPMFYGNKTATVYFLPGTTGWGSRFDDLRAMLWNKPVPYDYTVEDDMVTITGYSGLGGTVTVPSTINFLPVTAIGVAAFINCITLKSITIPNGVKTIDYLAFDNCRNLIAVKLPNGVTSIGSVAFGDCTSLASINIPNSVSSIGSSAFDRCSGLTSVTIPNSVTNIGDSAFSATGLTSFVIPNRITSIGYETFATPTLKSVVIPNSVQSILAQAFYGCSGLKSVTIPNSVTSIGDAAFNYCSSLTSIKMGNNVKSIGPFAFGGCPLLTSVIIPNSVTNIGDFAFINCYGLTNVTVGTGVTTVGDSAFRYCLNLTQINFQGNAPSLGSSVFDGDGEAVAYYLFGATGWGLTFGGLPVILVNPPMFFTYRTNHGAITITGYTGPGGSVIVPSKINGLTVTRIEDRAFIDNSKLTRIRIPNSVTNIGDYALSGCTSLDAITVEALNPIYISVDGVLFNRNQTTLIQCPGRRTGEYVVPNSVTTIGGAAFFACYGLANVSLPDGVASIESEAFYNCSGLVSIKIGNNVTNIGSWAFWGCTSLTSITFPSRVTQLGSFVFFYCVNLTGVYFQGNAPDRSGGGTFQNADNAIVYYLPETTGWSATFDGVPAILWNPKVQPGDLNYDVASKQFGFTITGSSNIVVVVEACAELQNLIWTSVGTNTLINGASYFSDPASSINPNCFYRLRSP